MAVHPVILSTTSAMTPTNADLRQFINQFFSDEELEMLCFDYFPEAANEFGGGMSKNRKVIALIGYCDRRGRLADLYAALTRERAEGWNRVFAATQDIEKPSFPEKTRFPGERDPRQVFLSHATADAEFAHRLKADLEAEGWRVWIAPESIRPGEKWMEAINRGLETSGIFVVVLTLWAVESKMVMHETYAAIDLNHSDDIRLTMLDVVECRLPILWRQFQYINFRQSYESGLDALLRWLFGEPISADDKEAKIKWLRSLPDKVFPGMIFLGPPPQPEIRVHEKTGIELIRIPAGPFLYGDDKQKIELPEYWIGRTPVTNTQYKHFVDATGHRSPSHWNGKTPPTDKLDHPVYGVSWNDTKAFCDWAGVALPTEEQWEKAARGTDGRIWPWGDDEPTNKHCNFGRKVGGTTPVGKYSPQGDSPFGCVDMVGNVWEWTASWYDEDRSGRAERGGSWETGWRSVNVTERFYDNPESSDLNFVIGFRVVELLSDPDS